MDIKEALVKWSKEIFGEIYIEDIFNIDERIQPDKEGNRIRTIVLFVKKKKGIKKDWTQRITFKKWEKEIKSITGDLIVFRMDCSESHEMRLRENLKKDQRLEFDVYGYQFNLVIVKKYGRDK